MKMIAKAATCAAVFSLFAGLTVSLTACHSPPVVYTSNPYSGQPEIKVIAVSPFLVKSDIAGKKSQPFTSMMFATSDGSPAYFSSDFADSFANGLTKFPGLTVIGPERVFRAWMEAEDKGDKDSNPLATRSAALKIARRLGADAILSAEVVEWDPYVPRITLDWSLNYTRSFVANSADLKMLENAGKGGYLESRKLGDSGVVYSEQLTLDGESASTNERMRTYQWSLEKEENGAYDPPGKGVLQRPYPRFVRFAAWAALSDAFAYERTVREGDGRLAKEKPLTHESE